MLCHLQASEKGGFLTEISWKFLAIVSSPPSQSECRVSFSPFLYIDCFHKLTVFWGLSVPMRHPNQTTAKRHILIKGCFRDAQTCCHCNSNTSRSRPLVPAVRQQLIHHYRRRLGRRIVSEYASFSFYRSIPPFPHATIQFDVPPENANEYDHIPIIQRLTMFSPS